MNRYELKLHAQLNEPKRRRLEILLKERSRIAKSIAEFFCAWGIIEFDSLDRQLSLVETAISSQAVSPRLRRELIREWVEQDAALIHAPGHPGTFDCASCRNGGALGVEDVLARALE